MKKSTVVSLYVAGAMLCAAGILTAVIHEVWGGKIPLFPKLGVTAPIGASANPQPVGANLGEQLPDVTAGSSIIREDMSIFWVSNYKKCDHQKVREMPPAPETIGWTYQKFAQYYTGYTMTPMGSNLRMERTIDQYCPDHYIIKSEADGYIYVYRNVDGQQDLTMLTKMSFTIDMVPEDYREMLKEGMAFGSIEEIEGLIEDAES